MDLTKFYYAECITAYGVKLWRSESKADRDKFVEDSMGFANAISEEDAIPIRDWHFNFWDEQNEKIRNNSRGC